MDPPIGILRRAPEELLDIVTANSESRNILSSICYRGSPQSALPYIVNQYSRLL